MTSLRRSACHATTLASEPALADTIVLPDPSRPCGRSAEQALRRWFAAEVLPLDGALARFLARACRDWSEVQDLKQEVYARVYDRARQARPLFSKAFVFSTARNLLIDRARRRNVAIIEYMAEPDALNLLVERIEPERSLLAKEALGRFQAAIDHLPRRCREVVVLRKVQGVPQREVAARLGITEDTVERQVLNGMRKLALAMSA